MFDYELIDTGNYRRLERFGNFILDRPAPQATWNKKLKEKWKQVDAIFNIENKNNKFWEIKNAKKKEPWTLQIDSLFVELSLGTNGQIGIFPEQYTNWQWISNRLSKNNKKLKILNGFSYTGIASSIALKNKNIEIYNVDALKSVSKRFYRNLELSSINSTNTKFFTDDILSFLKREIKRANKYDAFILDPPAFGRFKNKTWSILRDMPKLANLVKNLLTNNFNFVLVNIHDERINKTRLKEYYKELTFKKNIELVNLTIKSKYGNSLPAGISLRITS